MSASSIMVAPEIVPPGRRECGRNACRIRHPVPDLQDRQARGGVERFGELGLEPPLQFLARDDRFAHVAPADVSSCLPVLFSRPLGKGPTRTCAFAGSGAVRAARSARWCRGWT